MIANQSYTLDVTPGAVPPVIDIHQSETVGRRIYIQLISRNGSIVIPSAANAYVEGYKPDGTVFSYKATLTPSTASLYFNVTSQMAAVHGDTKAQIKIVSGSEILYAANFIIRVQRDWTANVDVSDTEIPGLVQQAQAAAEAAEQAAQDIDASWFINGVKTTPINTYTTTSKLTDGAINELKGRADANASDITSLENGMANAYLWRQTVPTGTDLNTVTTAGRYYLSGNNTYTNIPENISFGQLEVLRGGSSGPFIVQRLTSSNVTIIEMFRQSSNSGSTWTKWSRPYTVQPALTFTDANDLTIDSIGRSNAVSGASVANLPDTDHSYHVVALGNVQLARQTSAPFMMYARNISSNVWKEWYPVQGLGEIGSFKYENCTGTNVGIRRWGKQVIFQVTLTTTASIPSGTSGAGFVTFPTGYRPSSSVGFIGQVGSNVQPFYLDTNGKVQALGASIPSGTTVRLSGSFYQGN